MFYFRFHFLQASGSGVIIEGFVNKGEWRDEDKAKTFAFVCERRKFAAIHWNEKFAMWGGGWSGVAFLALAFSISD